jgi:acetyl esterase/lipase
VLPEASRATGQAVLIAPGGGYLFLSMDNEGLLPAKRLAEAGIAAFVLKYRLKAAPVDDGAFTRAAEGTMLAATRTGRDEPEIRHSEAVDDAVAAMRLLRARSALWGLDAARLGAVGFSAGAITLREMLARDDPGTTPDNVGLIYGPTAALEMRGPRPPLFTAMAADDEIFGGRGFALVEAWHRTGARCEFHCYERGGHGFGLPPQGLTSDRWFDQYLAWLRQN